MLKISGSHFEDTGQLCHSRPPDVTHDENSEIETPKIFFRSNKSSYSVNNLFAKNF